MIDFRDHTCGECAWHRKITLSDQYGKRTMFQCGNAVCSLPDVCVPKTCRACPAFVPQEKISTDFSRSILENKDE